MAGNGSLYTLDFYRLLREHLTDRGLVVQWLPFHLLSHAKMRMTARTFLTAFPHTTLWLSAIRHHGLLVGTVEELRIDYGTLQRKLERPGVRQELAPVRATDALDVLSWFVMGEEALAGYGGDARLNSDDRPYLEVTPALNHLPLRPLPGGEPRELGRGGRGGGATNPATLRGHEHSSRDGCGGAAAHPLAPPPPIILRVWPIHTPAP